MSKPDRYNIPAVKRHRVEDDIKRSRFITTLAHVQSHDEARAFVAEMKAEFPDATHNCWAFAAGPPGDTAIVGMSDDGEPHGTAGRPMLNTILHGEVGELAAVVTRYFGGIKLGTGGLVRAYTDMVNLGLDSLPVREKFTPAVLSIVIDYTAVTQFKRLLPDYEAELLKEDFGADATFEVLLPEEHAQPLEAALVELTNGAVLVDRLQG